MVNQLGWGTIVRYGLYCAHARYTQIYLLTYFVSFLILIPAVKLVLCGNKQLIASVITSSTVDGLMASLSLTEMSLLWDWLQSS